MLDQNALICGEVLYILILTEERVPTVTAIERA